MPYASALRHARRLLPFTFHAQSCPTRPTTSEDAERLLGSLRVGLGGRDHLQNVEAHGLGQGAALAHSHDIALLDSEARADVHGHVAMALLKTTVLGNEVKVVTADDDSVLHLSADDHTLQDASSDRDIASERALLVHILLLRKATNHA